jgi:hypothetical protein
MAVLKLESARVAEHDHPSIEGATSRRPSVWGLINDRRPDAGILFTQKLTSVTNPARAPWERRSEFFRSHGSERDDERFMAVSRIGLQRLLATGGIRSSAANRVYPGLSPIHPSWGPGVRCNSTVAGQPTPSPLPPPLQNVISSLMTLQTEI